MNPLLKKMNFKDEKEILVLNIPKEIQDVIKDFEQVVSCITQPALLDETSFVIAFVLSKDDINDVMVSLNDKLSEDVKLWLCYPKKSSKNYKSEINRDKGWEQLGEQGFEPVRQVSVNDDFSALRFRRVNKIKTITRSKKMALTDEAKKRTTDKTKVEKEMKQALSIIEAIENPRRKSDALEILDLMNEVITDNVRVWENKYIGFGHYHYVNKTNEGDMPVLSMVPAKAHMTLYFTVGGLKHYQDYLDQLGQYRQGKICLYISNMSKINKDVFRSLITKYYEDVSTKTVTYND